VATKKAKKRTPVRSDHTNIAYQGIKKMLFENEILPGQKISYHQLAERLHMSNTPVIQALKLIEVSGIVRHEPNRGYFTEPISLKEIQEIYDTREIIEISLLPAIMNNLEEDGITKLRDSLEIKAVGNPESELYERLKTDRNFHLTLASLSNHKTQVQILRYLFDLLYLKYSTSLLFVASERFVGTQHQTIFNTIVAQNLKDAQDAIKSHFSSVKAQVLKSLGQTIAQGHTVIKA
jgi:DNA-binding GntR family transcriptional regulator